MKRIVYILLLSLFVLFTTKANATHLVGGFISYQYVGKGSFGTRYIITITAYRDCNRDNLELAQEIDVCIYNRSNGSNYTKITFDRTSLNKVLPVGRTDCPEVSNACLERGIYRKEINLPNSNFGYYVKYEVCCRNVQVNLKNNSDGDPYIGQTYEAIIPPTSVVNSSPFFTDVPVPFMCVNDTTEINNYAVDADGDSLVYRLATPWYGASLANNFPGCTDFYSPPQSIDPSDYVTGYNGQKPFGNTGLSLINSQNGVTTFLAKQVGNYATALDVIEYRNGEEISRTRLDLQILVLNCTPNNKPFITNSSKSVSIVAGEKICIDISAKDVDNHFITMKGIGNMLTGANGFTGTKATFSNATGKGLVTSQFCWQTDCDQAQNQPYLLTIQAIDDGCPSKSSLTNFSFTVRPFSGKATVSGPNVICQGSKNIIYTLTPSASTPGELTGMVHNITVNNGTLISRTGNQLTIEWNSNATSGSILVETVSQYGCKGPSTLFVANLTPAPAKPVLTPIDTICTGTNKNYSIASTNGYTYRWWATNGTINGSNTSNSVNVTWSAAPGKAVLKVVQYNQNGCASDTAFVAVWISKPLTSPILGTKTICPNSKGISYSVGITGPGSTYKWFVSGGTIVSQNKNEVIVNWGNEGQGMVKVIEVNRLGCPGDTVYLPVNKTYFLIGETIKGDTSLCEFSQGQIYDVIYTKNSEYHWSISGGVIVSGQLTNAITVNWGQAGTGSLTMYETSYDSVNFRQCISNPTTRIINLRPYPTARTIEGDFEVCQLTGSGQYTIKGFPNSTYLWSINGNSTGITGQGTNTITYTYLNAGSFTISVIETSEFGCAGPLIDTVLIVHPKPTTTPILGDSIICYPQLTNYNYTTSGFANSDFYWFVNGGTPVAPSNTTNITINWNGQQLNTIKVLEISEFGCPGDTMKLDVFYDNPFVYLNYITVNPPPAGDNGIDLFWELKNAPRYNSSIFIERREAGSTGSFVNVGTVAGTQLTFNHSNINTDLNAWEYRVKGFDLCGQPLYTNIHTNILLTGKKVNGYEVQMDFTPYIGWGNSQIRYDVYRQLKNSSGYELYEANVSDFNIFYANGLEHYTQCYRIKATKVGSDTATWSNEICFDFEPVLYIPNAFSPNDDDNNNNFIMKGGALKSVEINVYNRWGEKLFVGNSLDARWDGTYKGRDQPQDVYIYYCTYTGFDGRKYSTKGTITLLR